MENKKVLIRIQNLTKHFPIKKKSIFQREQLFVQANDNITLDIYEGETFGLVGESGCGKSTLGRVILQLYPQTSGTTLYYGRTLEDFKPKYVRRVIHQRLVAETGKDLLQEKLSTLNPRQRRVRSRYEDVLRIAGGLVLADDLHEVSRVLEAEYEASTIYSPLAARLVDLEMNRDVLENLENRTMEENQRLADCKQDIEQLMPQLKRAKLEFDTRQDALDKLKDRYASKEGFARLDKMQDHGIDLAKLTGEEIRVLRRELQVIFQDPYSSLNPRLTVGQLISEALTAHNIFKAGTGGLLMLLYGVGSSIAIRTNFPADRGKESASLAHWLRSLSSLFAMNLLAHSTCLFNRKSSTCCLT